MWTDALGNAITLADGRSQGAVDDFVEGFIASEARAVNILAAAQDDGSAIVQGYAAAVHMFAESREGPANARPFLERAQAGAAAATPREQRFIAAVEAWVHGDIPRAIRLHEEQAREHPRDLASVKLGQYHLFNAGDSPGMLRIALAAQPAASDVPYLHGMLAFGYEQCHQLAQAEAAARHAIDMRRKEPWAHHALAHVMLTQGRNREGHEFMASVSDTWTGLNSFMVTHNWWPCSRSSWARRVKRCACTTRRCGAWPRNTRRTRSMPCRCSRGSNWRAWTWASAGRTSPGTWSREPRTMCCPSSTCSTCTGWRAPDAAKPTH
jgi:hypothetical protein